MTPRLVSLTLCYTLTPESCNHVCTTPSGLGAILVRTAHLIQVSYGFTPNSSTDFCATATPNHNSLLSNPNYQVPSALTLSQSQFSCRHFSLLLLQAAWIAPSSMHHQYQPFWTQISSWSYKCPPNTILLWSSPVNFSPSLNPDSSLLSNVLSLKHTHRYKSTSTQGTRIELLQCSVVTC